MMKKYFLPGRSPFFYLLLLISLSASMLFGHFTFSQKNSCRLEFSLETDDFVEFSIYYNIGRGLNQKDFQTKEIEQIGQPTTIDFCIPVYSELHTIRFDPAAGPVSMKIHSINIYYGSGEKFNVPFDTLQANDQIMEQNVIDGSFSFTTKPDANDPVFMLSQISASPFVPESNKTVHYILWGLIGLILAVLGRFCFLFFFLGV